MGRKKMGKSLHLARYNDNGEQSNGIGSVTTYTCTCTLIYNKLQKIACTTINRCRQILVGVMGLSSSFLL